MARRKNLTLNDLPLYADDDEIGEAVLGWTRRNEFKMLAVLQERYGMPKVSPVWGGRYVPAVKAFLDADNGLGNGRPLALAPNGVEGEFQTPRRMRKLTPRVNTLAAGTDPDPKP
jgi:hypothetical protein